MTNKGPEWQAVFGPISTSELIKGTYYIFPGIHLMCNRCVTEITITKVLQEMVSFCHTSVMVKTVTDTVTELFH